MANAHLAFDLGASSGRAIVGVLDGSPRKLVLHEVHRFEHLACPSPTGPLWDLTGIWHHILIGLRQAKAWCDENQLELVSVGVDTWGVDWVLLGYSGELLSLPHCYRDPQNQVACDRVIERLGGFEKLFERTGIQLMSLNTLFQVYARHEKEPKLFDAAKQLIFLPDLFHYWLSGEVTTERTIASTSSMLQVESGEWDFDLLKELGLPTELLGPMIEPGTEIGTLRSEIAEQASLPSTVRVIAPASHDTASAIAAVPATADNSWAYLSSGTWSLLGVELSKPCATERARQVPFTNERGVDGTIRLLKNIAGLWLIQELRRDLSASGDQRDFAQLVDEARQCEAGRTLIDPNYGEFATPGKMREKIQAHAREHDQPVPETVGQFVRCCLESLALCYSHTLQQVEQVVNQKIDVLHIVGGGVQNTLLNELTAAAVGRPVVTGPVEATAIGNLLVQAIGCNELTGLADLRQVVADSFAVEKIESADDPAWDELRGRYVELVTG